MYVPYETYGSTRPPPRRQTKFALLLRDGTCTSSEADESVSELQDAEMHHREGVACKYTCSRGSQQNYITYIARAAAVEQHNSTTYIAATPEQRR